MHNIVLHISKYLFPWLHVLCDFSPINNARKHAISAIFIAGCLFKKGKEKEKNKDNSTHINSNSITYIIRRTSITDKHTN